MGQREYTEWIEKGRPYRLMRPAAELRDVLRAHGYTVFDRGDHGHMVHEPPEDHTPYSETGYPGKARYGVGYAIDIMPPTPGQRSKVDGQPLPSLAQLGARIHTDRRTGRYGHSGLVWVKYMNWEPGDGNCWHDSWQPNYARRSSTDRGHIHVSGLTGHEATGTGGYDPVARIREEHNGMAGTVADKILGLVERIDRRGPDWHKQDQGDKPRSTGETYGWRQQRALLEAILAAVQGVDQAVILARIDQLGADVEAGQQQLAQVLVEQVAPALVDELRDQLDDITEDRLTAAVQAGIGRVAEAILAAQQD